MVRTKSLVSLSKFDIGVMNCTMCSQLIDTSQKPFHTISTINPNPILFVSEFTSNVDATTQHHLSTTWGKWLCEFLSTTAGNDRDWTIHNLTMCPCEEKSRDKIDQVKQNCKFHYERLIKLINPYAIVFMGLKNDTWARRYIPVGIECAFLGNPELFVPLNNKLEMSRFTLTVKQLFNEKNSKKSKT